MRVVGFLLLGLWAATSGLYRTAPLRGLRDTAPYFHDGCPADKAALIAFLDSL